MSFHESRRSDSRGSSFDMSFLSFGEAGEGRILTPLITPRNKPRGTAKHGSFSDAVLYSLIDSPSGANVTPRPHVDATSRSNRLPPDKTIRMESQMKHRSAGFNLGGIAYVAAFLLLGAGAIAAR